MPATRKVPLASVYVPVRVKFAKTANVPAELFKIVPEPFKVRLPVVVAVPEPTFKVPLLSKVLENSMLPESEPILPVEVAAPVKVKVPEVEVTTEPSKSVVAPVTVRAKAAELSVPLEARVTRVPPMVAALVTIVAVSAVLSDSKLKNVLPVMF